MTTLKKQERLVGGLYIERQQALLLTAIISRSSPYTWEFQRVEGYQEYSWDPQRNEQAQHLLYEIGRDIGRLAKDGLKTVGVAGFGPFLSLDPDDPKGRYGVVDPHTAPQPFQGVNLAMLFKDALKSTSGSVDIRLAVHTDANACALAESVLRNEGPDMTTLYVLVTEGIGCGFVTGQTIHRGALHPELGLISVRFDAKDHLKPPKSSNLYAHGLGFLANNNSMRLRHATDTGTEGVTNAALLQVSNDHIWNLRAYYIAQGCLACAALFAPHRIAIGTDLDPPGNIAELTRSKFVSFVREREREQAPLFHYDALDREAGFSSFISTPTPIPDRLSIPGLSHTPRITGAIGMCAAAAEMAK